MLTPELRRDMIQTAIDLANEDYDVLMPQIQEAGDAALHMNAELARAGYSVSDFFLQPLQKFEGQVSLDHGTGAVSLVGAAAEASGLGSDDLMTNPGGQSNASGGTGPTDKVSQVVQRAKQLFDGGTPPAAIRAGIVTAMTKGGVSPEEQQQTLQQVASAIGVDPQTFVAGTGEFATEAEGSPNGEGSADADTQALVAERTAEIIERSKELIERGDSRTSIQRYIKSKLMAGDLGLNEVERNRTYDSIVAQVFRR